MPSKYAIIVAGGRGSRMQNDTPKQFLLLNGLPVMMHTLHAFHQSASQPTLIVALPAELQEEWYDLCYAYQFHVPHFIADGGESRFDSVKNSLGAIREMDNAAGLIAIHDAVRPLISTSLIDASYEHANIHGAVALAVQSTNSVRVVIRDDAGNMMENRAFPREQIYLMQTPQTFRADIIHDAYTLAVSGGFTDDASVVEKKGYPIVLLDGDIRNIKITYPADLKTAECLLTQNP